MKKQLFNGMCAGLSALVVLAGIPPAAAVEVSTVAELAAALESMNPTATSSDEIVLAKGTYDVSGLAQRYYDGGWKDSDSHIALANLTLRGATGDADDVVIRGNGTARVLHAVGGTVAHLTITGGNATGSTGGGGVFAKNTTSVFTNVTVTGCKYTGTNTGDGYGGGASVSGTWQGCRFSGNESAKSAGVAYGGVFVGCTFMNNTAASRSGVMSYATCRDSWLEGNKAPNSTGGCAYQTAFSNCTFVSNSSKYGGAVTYSQKKNSREAIDCTFIGNSATSPGGATYEVDCIRCTFINNSSTSTGGAMQGGTAYDCNIISNTASGNGGGCNESSVVSNCYIFANITTKGSGGGLYKGTAYDCRIVGNSATGNGGAQYSGAAYGCQMVSNACTTAGGGAYGSTAVSNCLVACNRATSQGGGLSSCTNVYDCSVVSNWVGAGNNGGGFNSCFATNCLVGYNAGAGCVGGYYADCTIVSNVTGSGGAAGRNHAVFTNCVAVGNVSTDNSGTTGAFTDCTLHDCIVRDNGYATYGGATRSCTVYGGFITGNYAYYGGAGYESKFYGVTISNNSARCYGGAGYSCLFVGSHLIHNSIVGTGKADVNVNGGACHFGTAVDSVIEGNGILPCVALNRQGGACSNCTLTNCIVRNNFVCSGGTGPAMNTGKAYGCVFSNNVGAVAVRQTEDLVNCDFYGDDIDGSGPLINCRIMNFRGTKTLLPGDNVCTSGTFSANAYLMQNRTCCTNCLFAGNETVSGGALFFAASGRVAEFVNCTFASNRTDQIFRSFNSSGTRASLVNCIVAENLARDGSRFDFSYANGSYLKLQNCLVGPVRSTAELSIPEEGTVPCSTVRFDSKNSEHPYSIRHSSPARGRGLVADWMTAATDVRHDAAFPRLGTDGTVDIGCYQCWLEPVGSLLLVR